jgi:hypothetical protein
MRAVKLSFFTRNTKYFDGWTNKIRFPPSLSSDTYLYDHKFPYAKIYFINDGFCILPGMI